MGIGYLRYGAQLRSIFNAPVPPFLCVPTSHMAVKGRVTEPWKSQETKRTFGSYCARHPLAPSNTYTSVAATGATYMWQQELLNPHSGWAWRSSSLSSNTGGSSRARSFLTSVRDSSCEETEGLVRLTVMLQLSTLFPLWLMSVLSDHKSHTVNHQAASVPSFRGHKYSKK